MRAGGKRPIVCLRRQCRGKVIYFAFSSAKADDRPNGPRAAISIARRYIGTTYPMTNDIFGDEFTVAPSGLWSY